MSSLQVSLPTLKRLPTRVDHFIEQKDTVQAMDGLRQYARYVHKQQARYRSDNKVVLMRQWFAVQRIGGKASPLIDGHSETRSLIVDLHTEIMDALVVRGQKRKTTTPASSSAAATSSAPRPTKEERKAIADKKKVDAEKKKAAVAKERADKKIEAAKLKLEKAKKTVAVAQKRAADAETDAAALEKSSGEQPTKKSRGEQQP